MRIIFSAFLILKTVFSSITVLGPPEFKKLFRPDYRINASLSNFGKIPYGFTLIGRLHWDPTNTDVEIACKRLNSSSIPELELEVDQSPIMMVDRGNCNFAKKLWNIEQAGGKVGLIVDNKTENVMNIMMADDGTGKDITIPGLLISLEDGNKIKEYWRKNVDNPEELQKISFEINFEIERQKIVAMSIFFSSDDFEIYEMLMEFHHYYNKLGDTQIHLAPYYVLDQAIGFDPDNRRVFPNCVSGGEFCARKNKLLGVKDPIYIINENLRQKCIYNKYNNKLETYFNYIERFYKNCMKGPEPMFNATCSDKIMAELKIDADAITNCLTSSFVDYSKYKEVNNTILQSDASIQKYMGAYLPPTIFINGRRFSGSKTAANVFEAVCAGYLKKPELCYEESDFRKTPTETGSLRWGTVFFIIFIVLIVNLLIYILCRRYISKKIMERLETTDINHRINTVVTSYMTLQEGGNK